MHAWTLNEAELFMITWSLFYTSPSGVWQRAGGMPSESRTDEQHFFSSRVSSSAQRQCSSFFNLSYQASRPVGQSAHFIQLVGQKQQLAHTRLSICQRKSVQAGFFLMFVCIVHAAGCWRRVEVDWLKNYLRERQLKTHSSLLKDKQVKFPVWSD